MTKKVITEFATTDFHELVPGDENPFVKGWDTSPDTIVNDHKDKQQGESIFKLIYEKTRGVIPSKKKGDENERKS